ncbi:MAG TPA: hypothetical protein VGK89_05210 [Candidatus Eisenbacteria bacterium]|jgi:hypothetical protein
MARAPSRSRAAQAWIELRAEDPEAVSALAVARARLDQGASLAGLRRMRVFELRGALPRRAALAELLHRSTQFYNPAKERCTLRLAPGEPAPLGAGEVAVLVWERGGERRPAAERWLAHEAGRGAEVREGVAWALTLAGGAPAEETARDLAVARGRRHGLLSNPHFQEARIAAGKVPLPWIGSADGGPAKEEA